MQTVEDLFRLRDRPRRLLAVFPHPDDESYGPAGTLYRAKRNGAATAVYCMTRGEASMMGAVRGMTRDEVAELREQRMREVADTLKLDALLMGGFPDANMARSDLGAMSAALAAILEAFRPQVVISHDPRGVNAHADHIATHWSLRHALLAHPEIRLAMVAYPPEVAESIKPRLLFPTPEEEIDAILHLDEEELQAKERCLRIHEALVTLVDDADAALIRRPPVERYDFLGEDFTPPVDDLFAGIAGDARRGR